MHMSTVIKITGSVIVNWMKQVCLQTIQSLMCTTSTSKSDNIPALLYTLNINQSNVSTKLKRHDFVIPEIEVTSQLIDLRSSATLCWSVKVRPWPCRRWQFEGTVVSNVPSGVWHIDCILIMWLTRRSRRIRLKEINLARWVSYAVDIVSGQVMPNAARTNWRWDALHQYKDTGSIQLFQKIPQIDSAHAWVMDVI